MSELIKLRAWARNYANMTKGRLAEYKAWAEIADHGQEWPVRTSANGKPWRGRGGKMPHQYCFYNAAATVLGHTEHNPAGCEYAEGFALSAVTGLWMHHAWVVLPDGRAMDRTWDDAGLRYVGVIIDVTKESGHCYLAREALGIAWAPHIEDSDKLKELLSGAARE